jgi:two-component system sensor histidine kinase QseC
LTSIGRQLRRQLLVGLGIALALSGLTVWAVVRRTLYAQFDGALLAKARFFATVIKQEPGEGLVIDLDETPMPEFERPDNPEYFQVWLPDGSVMARSRSLGEGQLATGPAAPALPRLWDLPLPGGRHGRAVMLVAPVRWENEGTKSDQAEEKRPDIPVVRLALARDRGSLDAALANTSFALALGALLLLLGVPLLVTRAVRRGLRPLDELGGQAARIDARSLGRRFGSERVPEELRPICDRLNDLLERLEASFDRERRFSADVAHELRTPIAELRSIAEVALRYPDATPGRSFEDVLGASVHMEALITALSTLSRCESGRQPVNIETVDLARVCQETWAAIEQAAAQKGVRSSLAAGTTGMVCADPLLLGSVATNLFSNAVEYTPPGGEIGWRIEPEGAQVVLTVTNTNTSLETADLAHVFERFWRKDAARSGGEHGGLGLSLCQAFVRLMNGHLRLDLPRPDLVRVELRLPASGAFSGAGNLSVMYAS